MRKKQETKNKYAYLFLISQFLGFYRGLSGCEDQLHEVVSSGRARPGSSKTRTKFVFVIFNIPDIVIVLKARIVEEETKKKFFERKNRKEFSQAHCACAYVKICFLRYFFVFFIIPDNVKVLQSKNSQGRNEKNRKEFVKCPTIRTERIW